jgi:ubiquinone/menaquinone biosynthesis C-methylase UbiE
MVISSSLGQVKRSFYPHNYRRFSSQYSKLQIENSYFLAFRAAAELLEKHRIAGTRLLDFGCGTGRSTRFLKNLGFEAIGADISQDMLSQARQAAQGDYYWLDSKEIPFSAQSFDIIFQSFVLLEYSSLLKMINTFEEFDRVLCDNGIVMVVTGSEEYYRHNWLSFKIGDADEINREETEPLTSGCKVKVSIKGTDIVLFDYFWTDDDYRQVFQESGFYVVDMVQPLAQGDEPFDWVNECEVPCWTIYVLKKQ